MIIRKRSPDSGIEPKTSDLPGSVPTFTQPGLLRNLMIEYIGKHNDVWFKVQC